MNKLLHELAEQATRKYDRLGDDIPFAQPDLEVFAELIIRECMNVNNQFVGRRLGEIDLDVVYAEHFGVKNGKGVDLSEAYLPGKADGRLVTIDDCVEYLSGCGDLSRAIDLKLHFGVKE